ncbi:predicted protein [Verticillium alfalfae VaMs.102]|uniref:Predicted protein n=1 Tax=Verticillium alfalfae (strain VaMs.102 / ATCC MYA-4576 / FGSC 10136) TaxID=526221 RepID=C9SFL6_VERA1|nr:predicted protein [Verticillium alfalfae VaMs.102]EEY17349.1 predicted protein [Verticillium alfalfae VaMs.102]
MTQSDRYRGDAHEERLLELQRLQLQRYWPAEFYVIERKCLTMVLGVIRIHHILTAAGFQYWDAWNLTHPVLKPIAEIFRSPLKRKLAILDENRRRILTNMVLTQQKVEKAIHAVIELHFQLLHLGRTRHITTCPDMRHNMLQRLLERYRNRADLQLEPFRVEKGSRGALRVVMVASGSAHTTEGRGRKTSVHLPTAEEGSRENPICLMEHDSAVLRQEHETMSESVDASNPASRCSVFTDAGFVDRDITDADLLRLYQFDTVQRFVVIPEPEDSSFVADSRSETRSTSSPPTSTSRRGTVSGPAASQTWGIVNSTTITSPQRTHYETCASALTTTSQKRSTITETTIRAPAPRFKSVPRQTASQPLEQATRQPSLPHRSSRRTTAPNCVLLSPETSSSPSLEAPALPTAIPAPEVILLLEPLNSVGHRDAPHRGTRFLISPPGSSTSTRIHKTPRKPACDARRQLPNFTESTPRRTSRVFASPHHADWSTFIIRRGDSANSGANLSGALKPSATT